MFTKDRINYFILNRIIEELDKFYGNVKWRFFFLLFKFRYRSGKIILKAIYLSICLSISSLFSQQQNIEKKKKIEEKTPRQLEIGDRLEKSKRKERDGQSECEGKRGDAERRGKEEARSGGGS